MSISYTKFKAIKKLLKLKHLSTSNNQMMQFSNGKITRLKCIQAVSKKKKKNDC